MPARKKDHKKPYTVWHTEGFIPPYRRGPAKRPPVATQKNHKERSGKKGPTKRGHTKGPKGATEV